MLDRLLRRRGDAARQPLDATFRVIAAELREPEAWALAPLKESPAAQRLLASAPDEQREAVVRAVSSGPAAGVEHDVANVCREIANALLRRSLPWDEQTIVALLDALIHRGTQQPRGAHLTAGVYGDPVNGVLRVVERFTEDEPTPEWLRDRLI